MKKIAVVLGTLGFMSVTSGASAVQYTTWNFKSNYASLSPTDASGCGSANSLACQVSLTIGGQKVLARAYSTADSTTNSAKLVGATMNVHSDSGLGVTSAGSDGSQLVDQSGRYDLIVFEAPEESFKWTEFELGYATSGTDVQAWVGNRGGAANYDFTQMCLSTTSATCTTSNSITSQLASLGTFSNVAANTPTSLNPGTNTGRYLVVAGDLTSSFNDSFKIKSVKGAPEPQTFALLGIGLLAMAGLSRRKQVSV